MARSKQVQKVIDSLRSDKNSWTLGKGNYNDSRVMLTNLALGVRLDSSYPRVIYNSSNNIVLWSDTIWSEDKKFYNKDLVELKKAIREFIDSQ